MQTETEWLRICLSNIVHRLAQIESEHAALDREAETLRGYQSMFIRRQQEQHKPEG